MNGPARITAFAVTLAGMVLSMSGCDQLPARDQLNKGVEAYKSATMKRRSVTSRRPRNLTQAAHGKDLSGHSALTERGPRSGTAENLKTANQAIEIFKDVLAKDPNDVNSLKQIAGIYSRSRSWMTPRSGRRRFSPWTPRILRRPTPSA